LLYEDQLPELRRWFPTCHAETGTCDAHEHSEEEKQAYINDQDYPKSTAHEDDPFRKKRCAAMQKQHSVKPGK
jgi:hypothetical protein